MKARAERPRAFRDSAAFRAWLQEHHATVSELLVRCCKARNARRGLTYRQALDEALCFGWIDGVRYRLDEVSFSVRFSPRKARSVWSWVNIRRAKDLQAEGRMQPPGQAAFERRMVASHSDEARTLSLDSSLLRRFRASENAWRFFQAQPPWYRRTCSLWVMSAKRPETRERRFAALVANSEAGRPIPPLRRASGAVTTPDARGDR